MCASKYDTDSESDEEEIDLSDPDFYEDADDDDGIFTNDLATYERLGHTPQPDDEYDAEKVVGVYNFPTESGGTEPMYLMHWKGWGPDSQSFESDIPSDACGAAFIADGCPQIPRKDLLFADGRGTYEGLVDGYLKGTQPDDVKYRIPKVSPYDLLSVRVAPLRPFVRDGHKMDMGKALFVEVLDASGSHWEPLSDLAKRQPELLCAFGTPTRKGKKPKRTLEGIDFDMPNPVCGGKRQRSGETPPSEPPAKRRKLE